MSTAALRSLSDQQVLNRTHELSVRERKLTLDLLLHLNEVDRRELYVPLAHASLFAYCTDELRYSSSAAKRRITTARCIARYPDVLSLLEANEVNLSTITQVSRILKPDNVSAVLEAIRGKSQREVEAIVAEYEPLAALPRDRARTVVVRVPVAPQTELSANRTAAAPGTVSPEIKAEPIQDRNGPATEAPVQPSMTLERRTVVEFTAREEVLSKLECVRMLASHRLPANAPLEQLIEFLADYFTEREDPKARHERREAKTAKRKPIRSTNPRQIPAQVRDEVFVRDMGQCTFVGSHARCGSAHTLQLDHVVPVALGGSADKDNLRLLCAKHNRLEAERRLL